MLLAETIQIDPGVVILILVVFALTMAAVAAVAIGTPIAGFRYGVDPTRGRARVVWVVGLCLEGGAVVLALAALDPWPILAVATLIAVSLGARRLGKRRAARPGPPPS